MATIIDPKLGEKTAARLGTASGQKGVLAKALKGTPLVAVSGRFEEVPIRNMGK